MRRTILLSFILICVVAPLFAKVLSDFNHRNSQPRVDVTPATKKELTESIKAANRSLPDSERFIGNFTVESYKRMKTWWYIVQLDTNGVSSSLIMSKFTNDAPRVVTLPGRGVPGVNISSGLGIPYAVIDEFNNNWIKDEDNHHD